MDCIAVAHCPWTDSANEKRYESVEIESEIYNVCDARLPCIRQISIPPLVAVINSFGVLSILRLLYSYAGFLDWIPWNL